MRWVRLAMMVMVLGWTVALTAAQVAIVSPHDGELVRSRRLLLRVQKPTSDGYVMVWLDGKFVSAIAAPFELTIDLAEREIVSGEHTLRVVGVSKTGSVEGEAQVRFQVDLSGTGIGQGEVRLVLQGRTGEIFVYTFRGNSEARAEVPTKAIRRKLPQFSSKLSFRWLQTIHDITVDRVFRVIRSVEEGTLEKESPIQTAGGMGAGMMGSELGMPGGAPMMGGMMPMGGAPTMGGMAPMGAGAGAPLTAATAQRLRIRPTDDQHLGWLSLLPNGETVEELPNVLRFVTGSIDIAFPDRPLKVKDTWQGFIWLPKNLENLTLVGAPTATGAGMGALGGEETGMPGGAAPFGGFPPMAGGMPGRSSPMAGPMGGMPMAGGGMPGMRAPAVGAPADAYLADAPVLRVPARHQLDGFEVWQGRLCVRIVSRFPIAADLDLSGAQQQGGMGAGMMGGEAGMPAGMPMMGAPAPMGAPTMAGTPPRMGGMMPGVGPAAPMGGMTGAPGQLPAARKLSGRGEGTRILLFDPQSGQVVYVKVEVKLTFDTDYATILPILPQLPSLPGVRVEAGTAGAPGMPGTPGMPGMPEAPMMGAPSMSGAPSAPMPGRPMPGGPASMGGLSGEEAGFAGGAPYAGAPYGGAPTAPRAPFAPQQQPVFRNVPARLLYTYTLENILDASGRLDMLLSGLAGR
ncbi:MAG: hypothetical protein REDVDVYQ_002012 [Candidatus Fervidibacter sp.]